MEQTLFSGIRAGMSSASLPAMPGAGQPAQREGWGYSLPWGAFESYLRLLCLFDT